MTDLLPQGDTTLLKPVIECCKAVKFGGPLPDPVPGVLNVLLDLTFLPAGCGVTEFRFKQVVADHGSETAVDLPDLASTNPINSCLHVVVDATARNATHYAKGMVMRIKEHFVGLQQVGA